MYGVFFYDIVSCLIICGVSMRRGGLWECRCASCEKGIMRILCKNAWLVEK